MTLAPEQVDEWTVDTLDLDTYLGRIGQDRAKPSAAALCELAKAHILAIPFENVDVVLEQHKGIALEDVIGKLVRRQRGGYCYEHGSLFAAAAEQLGYPVRRLVARVQPQKNGPYTHMTLVVEADGVGHLVDVGFGAGMLVPMPLVDGAVVDQAGWPHRLVADGDWWRLQKLEGGDWTDLHAFTLTPMHRIDYEVYHHYTSTHPRSPFTGQLVVMRLEEGLSRKLVGDEFIVERPDGTKETTKIPSERLDATLRELDVVLTEDELAKLLTIYPG
ncbi:arylamine N-acetyltransferase family protein [Amycolatopsis sp. lyj-108]|uniref:arylamine N-acetyltransferase family protein n=1 Tax=Amycolatopsis sp. lyj-108 TaxID=2789286 RepID=UPI00397907E7